MTLRISRTDEGISYYPLHRHDHWEIMLYLKGFGQMNTALGNIPFRPGTIIIVPPGVAHGSASNAPFQNIAIGGPFEHIFRFSQVMRLEDNEICEGQRLASLLLESRSHDEGYLDCLATAYLAFLQQSIRSGTSVHRAVDQIAAHIRSHSADSELRLTELLVHSGYAEDYIRQQFTRLIGMPPTRYLRQVRIERARLLIDIYGNTRPLSEIAESCGYTDYIIFSKTFRQHMGLSPSEYCRKIHPVDPD